VKHQNLQIARPLEIAVYWYDNLTVPPKRIEHGGEVIGWRASQVIVRIKDYAVVRFWKKSGVEVGNSDHQRRGFRVDLSELAASVAKPAGSDDGPGVEVPIATDTDA
jgi:hypothetical protein